MQYIYSCNTKYYELDYYDFGNIVKDFYGVKDYEFVADVECGNDSDHEYNAKPYDLTTEYGQKMAECGRRDIEKFINTNRYSYIASTLLRDLVTKGALPQGRYLINVCW